MARRSLEFRSCEVEGCGREAAKGKERCHGHRKQRVRQLRELRHRSEDVDPDEVPRPVRLLRERDRPPRVLLTEAALAYAEAQERDVERAYDLLRKAAVRYSSIR